MDGSGAPPTPGRSGPAGSGEVPGQTTAQQARLVVLVPAHNEAGQIGATLTGLSRQTRRPDRIIVAADNCTDDTVAIARSLGAEVYETVANTDKKAGALNQALVQRFRRDSDERRGADRRTAPRDEAGRRQHFRRPASPDLLDSDYVLVMDADTVLAPRFLEVAAASLDSSQRVGAAGGLFFGHPGGGVLGQLQRSEYIRYGRDIARTGKVMVLTGTATLFKVSALRQVAAARGTTLPGRRGHVYDTLALTEDNELTVALKTLGWRLTSPAACTVTTEIMPSWGDLWRQRMRWQRGAIENLRNYGWTRVTWRYWLQQFGMGLGVFAFQAYVWLTVLIVAHTGSFSFSPFWTAIGGIFLVERVVTAWSGGWRARLLAAPLMVELAYDLFLQAVFVRSLVDVMTGREATWHHVGPSPAVATCEGG